MIIGVDIGGSKTLVGQFQLQPDAEGSTQVAGLYFSGENEFATNKNYDAFISHLSDAIKDQIASSSTQESEITLNIALPAYVDRARGVALEFGNLDWKNVPISVDLRSRLGREMRINLENDAKSACLFEASQRPEYKKLLYITVSTGIGVGFCIDGELDKGMRDAEAGFFKFVSPDTNQPANWQTFASGKALYQRTGKLAKDIDEPEIWLDQSQRLVVGIQHLCAMTQPAAIVFGGSVGIQFEKFGHMLQELLDKSLSEDGMVDKPILLPAIRPHRAAIFGTALIG